MHVLLVYSTKISDAVYSVMIIEQIRDASSKSGITVTKLSQYKTLCMHALS